MSRSRHRIYHMMPANCYYGFMIPLVFTDTICVSSGYCIFSDMIYRVETGDRNNNTGASGRLCHTQELETCQSHSRRRLQMFRCPIIQLPFTYNHRFGASLSITEDADLCLAMFTSHSLCAVSVPAINGGHALAVIHGVAQILIHLCHSHFTPACCTYDLIYAGNRLKLIEY